MKVSPKESEDFQVPRFMCQKGGGGCTKDTQKDWLTERDESKATIAGGLYLGCSPISDKCHQEMQEGRPMRTIKGIFQTQFFGPRLPQLANTVSAKSMCSVVFPYSSKVL